MKHLSYPSPIILACALVAALLMACGNAQKSGDAHVARGITAFRAQDYQRAVQELQRATETGVTEYQMEEVYTTLGRAYEELDQYEQAIAAHQKAVEINPDYYAAWVNLGVAYRLAGNFDEAEKSYNTALQIEPEYAQLHASLGALYIFKNEPERAIASLEKAIELEPQLAVAHANLALAFGMVQQFDRAEASLRQATALGYKNTAIIQARINSLKALQQ